MAGFEVHAHAFVSGPRRNGGYYGRDRHWLPTTFSHSHDGGDRPHQHPETGPATYTIDKDEWFKATGLRGGGRKTFTKRPTGEQFPIVELEDWQKSFEIVIGDPPAAYLGEGPGLAPAARMVLGHKMTYVVRDGRRRARRRHGVKRKNRDAAAARRRARRD
jgi:hypothetical protein